MARTGTQPYKMISVPLDSATGPTPREIVARGKTIQSVTVMTLPPGAIFNLHFGSGEAVPIEVLGSEFASDDPCTPITDEGLHASFPAQLGLTVRLFVSFGTTRTASIQ